MLANTRGSLQVCSTSGRTHTSARSPPGRCRHLRTAAKQDTFCKDVVNVTKEVKAEGVARVSFLGAGGHEIQIDCPKDTYILEAGLQNDVELPYTCRGGICGSCVGRVCEGEVDMSDITDLTFTLEEEEIAKGMVLICMARPVTDTVKIETQSDWGYSLGVGEWKGATGHIAGKNVDPLTPWGTE